MTEEKIRTQEWNLWLKFCKSLWSVSGKLWHYNGWARTSGAVVWVKTFSVLCVLPLPISTGKLPSWLICPRLAGAWKKGCYERSSLSRWAAVKDLPVELRLWEDRGPITAGWLPSPLSRHWASFSPGSLPSMADCNIMCSVLHDQGEQISSTLTIIFWCCFSLIQWFKIVSETA